METMFLLFEGLYGSGKSTTSQYVADQLAHNGIQVEWLDEHQLLSRFFWDFAVAFFQGEPDLGERLLASWRSFVETYAGASGMFVCDGPFLTNNILRMLAVNTPYAAIERYAEDTLLLLAPLNPRIIYLTSDLQTTLAETCRVRGANWTRVHVAQIEGFAYRRARKRVGLEGLRQYFLDAQNLFRRVIAALEVDVLTIDTTARQWPSYQSSILRHLGIAEVPIQAPQLPESVQRRYVGVYAGEGEFAQQGPFGVELIDGELKLRTSYSDDYTLLPLTQRSYTIRGTRLRVEFVMDARGQVKGFRHTFWDGQVYACHKVEPEQG